MGYIVLKHFTLKKGNFSLTIEEFKAGEGALIAICGPNGSGKTSFLSGLAGLLPYQGSYQINSREFASISQRERTRLFAYLPQETRLHLPFDVFYVVLTGRYALVKGTDYSRVDYEKTEKVLETFDLTSYEKRLFNTLSGGEKKRVLLARTFNKEAKVLLLDEPFSELDIKHQLNTIYFLKNYAKDRKAVVLVVLHELQLAASFFDEVVLLSKGRMVFKGPPKNLSEETLSKTFKVKTKLVNLEKKEPFTFYVLR